MTADLALLSLLQVCKAWAAAAQYEPLWQARLVQQGWCNATNGSSPQPLPDGADPKRPAWCMYTLQVGSVNEPCSPAKAQ